MTALALDPASGRWRAVASPPIGPATAAVWTGDALVAVTSRGAAAAWCPDDRWVTLPDVPGWTTSSPSPRAWITRLSWTGSQVLAESEPPLGTLDGERQLVVAAFDPATGTWTEGSPAPFPIAHGTPHGTWLGDRLFFLDWWPSTDQPQTSATYDPASDTWAAIELPCRTSARDTIVVGQLLVGDDLRRAYDPSTGTCHRLPRLPARLIGRDRPLSRDTLVWTGTELVSWSGTPAEADPPLRQGVTYRPPRWARETP